MYIRFDCMFAFGNNTFMGSKIVTFRISVETSFDPIIHNESHP